MKYMFQLFRIPNLIIVGILQCLIYFKLLMPILRQYNIEASLPPIEFGLFVLVTLLITGGGYIINDLVDYDADIINNGNKVIINEKITLSFASWVYYGTIVAGFFLALFLAFFSRNLNLLWIFPVAVSGLFIYSIFLKRKAFIGNIVVSLFAGGVAGIVAIAARESLADLSKVAADKVDLFLQVVWVYVGFAFFSTLIREIVKDIEDVKGDAQAGFKTLPIVYGIGLSKKLTLVILIAFFIMTCIGLFLLLPWLQLNFEQVLPWMILIGCLTIFFEVAAIYLLWKAKTKHDFGRVSQLIKLIMVTGILFLSFVKLDY